MNTSHCERVLRKGVPDRGATGAPADRKALQMNYAVPFYYAVKALETSEPTLHRHQAKRRRRRIRLVLFPALRAPRPQTTVATAASSDC
jgi:hypothetical protein